MRSIQVIQSNKILLSCLSLYAVFLVSITSVDGAMLRIGIAMPKVFCSANSKCDNDSLCINHLNLTTGCYERLCMPQENLTDVTCDTLNCHQNYECKPCSNESVDCRTLKFECVLEKHRNCSTLKCDDDHVCKQQKPIPGKGAMCRAKLTATTHVCKRETIQQTYPEVPRDIRKNSSSSVTTESGWR